jgi:hypothetical protein
MKRLNVKWLPEAGTGVSIAIAPRRCALPRRVPALRGSEVVAACARLIVISGGSELKADVTAVQQRAA